MHTQDLTEIKLNNVAYIWAYYELFVDLLQASYRPFFSLRIKVFRGRNITLGSFNDFCKYLLSGHYFLNSLTDWLTDWLTESLTD